MRPYRSPNLGTIKLNTIQPAKNAEPGRPISNDDAPIMKLFYGIFTLEVIDLDPIVQGIMGVPINLNQLWITASIFVITIWSFNRANVFWV